MVSRRLEELEKQQHRIQSTLTKQMAHDLASKESLSRRFDMLEAAFGHRLDALESLRLDQRLATVEQQRVARALQPRNPGCMMQKLNVNSNSDIGPSDSEENSLSHVADGQEDTVAPLKQHDISDLAARLEDLVNDSASNTTMHEYVSEAGPSQQMQSKQRRDSVGGIKKQKQWWTQVLAR